MSNPFLKMLNVGIPPTAVMQRMCTSSKTTTAQLESFVRYCVENNLNLPQSAASAMIIGFEIHKQHLEKASSMVYGKMQRYGVPVEAIRQKANITSNKK